MTPVIPAAPRLLLQLSISPLLLTWLTKLLHEEPLCAALLPSRLLVQPRRLPTPSINLQRPLLQHQPLLLVVPPSPLRSMVSAMPCIVRRIGWTGNPWGIVGRHLKLLMEAAATVHFDPEHSAHNLRDLRSQRLIEAANNLTGFTGDVASLAVATEVFIQELEDMVAMAKRALPIHRALLQESVTEYAMTASSHDDD